MNKIAYCILLAVFILVTASNSQSYIPVNIQRAIDKGYRTAHGIPGENYFQNKSEYKIQARFDPKKGRLSGIAEITYFNNSADTLRKILLRLYQDIAKKGGIRDEKWEAANIHKGVRITVLKVGNTNLIDNLTHRTRRSGTNLTVYLPAPLYPNDSVALNIGWNFDMPGSSVHRYGKYDDGTYFVSLWYPQVAVYDDIDGWDVMNYTGTHEFYNDFNDYEVGIKVPGGFMVWATGTWINADRILQSVNYKRFKNAKESDDVIRIIDQPELNDQSYFINKRSNTFKFQARSIPDFAFGVSDDYVWDAASVIVDSIKKRRVQISAAYKEETKYFDSVVTYGCKIIRHFNNVGYNFPFPYDHITVFNGDGGMEYPMIVNNGATFSRDATIFLTMHEIAHSYFPFLTGINERKYSWVDEGLTTYLPVITEEFMQSDYYSLRNIVRNYQFHAGTEYDIPFSIPAYQTRGRSYQYYSYIRSSMAFHMLEEFMGRENFRSGISEFLETWQYKHPTPYDLFAVLGNNTPKDIDWFIDQWFFENGYPDLAIANVEQKNDSISVEIRCDGKFAVPVEMTLIKEDTTEYVIQLGPEIWRTTKMKIIKRKVDKKVIEIRLGNNTIPDITRENNTFKIE